MKHRFDVIVVGGGHAGCEAAATAARTGAETLLITHKLATIGEMSCNPAIGGIGKGHLVREVDALDGLIGRVADAAGIQFRLLNRSRGPAVRGPRAQMDRAVYRRVMTAELARQPRLTIVEGAVEDLILEAGRVVGVETAGGERLCAAAVVLTTGTFLRGEIHRGGERIPAGRAGDAPAVRLAERLYGLGLPMGRLKTGTPPRLDGRTIDWSAVPRQLGDEPPVALSFLSGPLKVDQAPCGVTETNARTHRIIAENLGELAVYGGAISDKGPRYCPSIEDKVVRFPDRTSHQVFLEPEGRDDFTVYPNGVSTSLAPATQERFLRTIRGLERVEVLRHGYAIAYDYVDPRSLTAGLEVKMLAGLFLAGQINGTTGYEEAAAQGVIAGLNAARKADHQEPAVIGRDQAYIGVMIDDLVTKGVSEPYRMFTSRAEFRLLLRADNADQRLTEAGVRLGCVGAPRARCYREKRDWLLRTRARARELSLTSAEAVRAGGRVSADGQKRDLEGLLSCPGLDWEVLAKVWPELTDWPSFAREDLEASAVYRGYLERQASDVAVFRRDEAMVLPSDLQYASLGGLSAEAREKLAVVRPATLAQAARIEGVTAGAVTALLAHVRRRCA